MQGARGAGRTILTEFESKQMLAAYGIPTVETASPRPKTRPCSSPNSIGYPVVLKLYSRDHHPQDRRGRRATQSATPSARSASAFNAIADAVREKAGAEHFQGVTVQPMVKLPTATS